MSKRIAMMLLFLMLITLYFGKIAHAGSWIYDVEGTVHSVWTTPSGVTYLKLQRNDGTKVAADCMLNDQMFFNCLQSQIDDSAEGDAYCQNGFCTWMTLEFSGGGFVK